MGYFIIINVVVVVVVVVIVVIQTNLCSVLYIRNEFKITILFAMILIGRLFHRGAAAFLKHILSNLSLVSQDTLHRFRSSSLLAFSWLDRRMDGWI